MLPHLRVDEERRRTLRNCRIERRMMRLECDPFALVDEQFIDLFRLNKDMVNFLLQEISPYMNNSTQYSAVHPHIKIFATLVFYGTGTYQRVIGQSYNLSVSQQTVTRCIKEVTSLIVEILSERFIRFPRHNGWKNQIKETFMEHTQFPGVIGAIDCTHIAIIRPREEEHNYMNRKGYHSKNIQIICDYNLRITNMNARYPGSCHDSFIWRNSVIQDELSQCYAAGDRRSWLVGDSGYPQQPWLMTPILNPLPGSPEERYNARHASARNCIERCNGVLKGRFRCLMSERKLRYAPDVVGNIAVACAVLHNLCIAGNLDIPDPPNEIQNQPPPQPNDGMDNNRTLLIEQYFT